MGGSIPSFLPPETVYMQGRTLLVGLLLSLSLAAAATAAEPAERPSPEENILRKAGVAVDGDGLLMFFRQRTPGDAGENGSAKSSSRLGADDFDDREPPPRNWWKVGGRATPLARAAARSEDAGVAVRAKAFLKEVDAWPAAAGGGGPYAGPTRVGRGRAGAAGVSPSPTMAAVEDEVLAALLGADAGRQGRPRPGGGAGRFVADQAHAAAAYVLGRNGDTAQREAVRKRLKDADSGVRWQAARGLLGVHDRAAVPCLVDLLADGPFDAAWRSEELLRRLAGDAAPSVWLDDTAEGRRKCRDAWAAWWKDKGDKVDVGRYVEEARRWATRWASNTSHRPGVGMRPGRLDPLGGPRPGRADGSRAGAAQRQRAHRRGRRRAPRHTEPRPFGQGGMGEEN